MVQNNIYGGSIVSNRAVSRFYTFFSMSAFNTTAAASNASTLPLTSATPSVEDQAAEILRLKRTIAQLHGAVSLGANKRLASTVTLGRGIRRAVSLFQDIPSLVSEADRRAEEEDDDSEESTGPTTEVTSDSQRNRDRTFEAYKQLVLMIPAFERNLLNTDGAALASYFAMLTRGANDARSDDISTMKKALANWLNKRPSTKPPLNPEDRINRGLQHDTTGGLLCPIEFDWDNIEIRAKLRACEEGFDMSSSYFIRCFYKGGKGDAQNVEEGFLRGFLLVKAYSLVFTSPSSANRVIDDADNENTAPSGSTSSPKATKYSVAQKLNLNTVTPRSIAYVAVLLHFSLTDAPHWKSTFNNLSYELMYNFIIDFFEDTSGPQAEDRIKSLFKWWNKQIFPVRAAAMAGSRASMNKLREQRAQREA
ncbi:hypothetical protein D9615_008830 [Tricholomella constricta]|uniref:Uncharacterized protein n=1 Tax=Tricholomella constricta TaxID=117010 RepID=A0A8H5H044_9AGAR|nr:hypothetical protein D9615_008830 [Tricholomella constricta]